MNEMVNVDERLTEMAARRGKARGHMSLGDIAKEGVTVSFLAQVFRMDSNKVKRKLANCPVLDTRYRGETQVQHIYDLATAAAYLVPPKVNIADLIENLRPEDLPPKINAAFWDAQAKRQKVEEVAGDLWRTDDVRDVLGNLFQTIKFTIQLWGDQIERMHGLSAEQRRALTVATDQLQKDIFDQLVENAKLRRTLPERERLPEVVESAATRKERLAAESRMISQEEYDDLV